MPDQDAFVPLSKERMVNPALKLFVTPGRFDLGTELREFQLAYDPLLWLPGQGRPDDTDERWRKRKQEDTREHPDDIVINWVFSVEEKSQAPQWTHLRLELNMDLESLLRKVGWLGRVLGLPDAAGHDVMRRLVLAMVDWYGMRDLTPHDWDRSTFEFQVSQSLVPLLGLERAEAGEDGYVVIARREIT